MWPHRVRSGSILLLMLGSVFRRSPLNSAENLKPSAQLDGYLFIGVKKMICKSPIVNLWPWDLQALLSRITTHLELSSLFGFLPPTGALLPATALVAVLGCGRIPLSLHNHSLHVNCKMIINNIHTISTWLSREKYVYTQDVEVYKICMYIYIWRKYIHIMYIYIDT